MKIIGTASQASLSRFYNQFDAGSIRQLNQVNRKILDKVHTLRESQVIIFDMNSTHTDTYGHQESSVTLPMTGMSLTFLKLKNNTFSVDRTSLFLQLRLQLLKKTAVFQSIRKR